MLQSSRNKQTLQILDRLRKQGAPAPRAIPLDMGVEEDEEAELGNDDAAEIEDPSGAIVSSPTIQAAKKKLKRRY